MVGAVRVGKRLKGGVIIVCNYAGEGFGGDISL